MDACGQPETWRELWRTATPDRRWRLVVLLVRLAVIVLLAVAVLAAGIAVAVQMLLTG